MFGALAGSGALPFAREAYRSDDPRRPGSASSRACAPSRQALTAPWPMRHRPRRRCRRDPLRPASSIPNSHRSAMPSSMRSSPRPARRFPRQLHGMIAAGLRKVADFQDVRYAREYLDLVAGFLRLERGGDPALTRAAAKHIAVAMAYDDVIRVADLKTRASRFERVRSEVGREARSARLHHRIHASAHGGSRGHAARRSSASGSKASLPCSSHLIVWSIADAACRPAQCAGSCRFISLAA